MEFQSVLEKRHSVRAFEKKAVPDEIIQQILQQACLSPSWSNTHPYKIAVATGEIIEDLRETLYARFMSASKLQRAGKLTQLKALLTKDPGIPDGDYKVNATYPKELQQRRFECGMGLYATAGIDRKDYKARDLQMAENFRFFGAPVAMFLFVHGDTGPYGPLDAGIYLQSLMLAATNAGLGTCAQGALGLYRKPIEKHFEIPTNYKLLCGLAVGFEADHKINTFQPEKIKVDELRLKVKAKSAQ